MVAQAEREELDVREDSAVLFLSLTDFINWK